jgi:type II pantothenate kinase
VSAALEYCGLDVGISTTDAVAAWAPGVAVSIPSGGGIAAEDAIRRLLERAPRPPNEISIAATGVGSHRLPDRVLGIDVRRVPEIVAIGRGGIGLDGGHDALVASLGTGTALVSVRGNDLRHVTPGNSIGGGTLLGLARAVLGTDDLAELSRLARLGDRKTLDITIGEAVGGPLGVLPAEGTASSFAKYSASASREDVAAALLNLVAESVTWTILLGLQVAGQSRAILTGKLLLVSPIRARMEELGAMLGGIFSIPPDAEVAAAWGAVWAASEDLRG